MIKNEFYFSSEDNKTKIHAVEWLPEGEPKVVLQLYRGVTNQMQNYEELVNCFTGYGFAVVGNDDEDNGLCHCRQEEMKACIKATKQKYPDVPHLLLGLSQGAVEVHNFVNNYPGCVEGVVLADAEQEPKKINEEVPMLVVSGMEHNCRKVVQDIYSWTEKRLDEMLYHAAIKQ